MKEKKLFYRYEVDEYDSNEFTLRERKLYNAQRNCFDTKEEAERHFKNAEQIAKDKYDKIMDGIEALKELTGDFSISAWAWVSDDTGLEYGAIIEFDVNGYNFKFRQ